MSPILSRGQRWRGRMAFLALLLPAIHVGYAKSFEDVLAPVKQTAGSCQPTEGSYGYSSQARALYDKEGLAAKLGLEPVDKTAQSFECGKDKSTVYLYSYPNVTAAEKAAKGIKEYIWGGTRRSTHHPEYIFTSGDVVVVVSGQKPKSLADLLVPPK